MIWLNPLALIGVAAIVAPVLIHILVQRRAPTFAFPTLRFLRPARLAAIRRHVLEDLLLLAVRAAILAAAASALAGPVLVTPARRAGWNGRTARAIVIYRDLSGPERAAPQQRPETPPPDRGVALSGPPPAGPERPGLQPSARGAARSGPAVAFQTDIETADLRDGIARAIVWLDAQPPASRELVIVAPFALGSLTRVDFNEVPPEVGVRLVRSGELPATRSFAAAPILEADRATADVRKRDRIIEFDGPSTSVQESASAPASVPIEIVAAADAKRAAEATLAAVLSQRVPAPIADRFARVVFASSEAAPPRSAQANALRKPGDLAPWMVDTIARLTIEGETYSSAAADGNALVVTTALPPTDLRTAMLLRSILHALAAEDRSTNARPLDRSAPSSPGDRSARALAEREILPIPDVDLRAWERPPGEVRTPRLTAIDRDDRQWWWAAALALLAVEAWIRSSRRERAEPAEVEAPRVA